MSEETRASRLFRTAVKVDLIYLAVIAVVAAVLWIIF